MSDKYLFAGIGFLAGYLVARMMTPQPAMMMNPQNRQA